MCGRGPYSRGSGGRSPPEAKFSRQFTEGIAVVSQQSQGKNQRFPGRFMKSFRLPGLDAPARAKGALETAPFSYE